ncbi:unnamed protein product [Callosobruchus maculatus]|nr:unnamed protein product [Callosobruchus maculatus]
MAPTAKFSEDNEKGEHTFPYQITPVDEDTNRELLKYFTGERTGFVQVGPKKWFFPSGYEKDAHEYFNFKTRPDDTYIITFPRSGTTWTQEMVWLIVNDLNYDAAARVPLTERFPFLEFSSFVHKETKAEFLEENMKNPEKYKLVQKIDHPRWKILERMTSRRFIKTHLPFSLLPPDLLNTGCKVVYIARNPKDVAVSFYHLNRLIRTQGYVGDFPLYWKFFQRNLQPWTPYWEHIREGWTRRHEKNVLFLFYEDMSQDIYSTIKKISDFFGKDYTKEQYEKLANHLDIENFRKNKSVNYDVLKHLGILKSGEAGFVRKGKSGGWEDYFTEELNQMANDWIKKNQEEIGIHFPNFSI